MWTLQMFKLPRHWLQHLTHHHLMFSLLCHDDSILSQLVPAPLAGCQLRKASHRPLAILSKLHQGASPMAAGCQAAQLLTSLSWSAAPQERSSNPPLPTPSPRTPPQAPVHMPTLAQASISSKMTQSEPLSSPPTAPPLQQCRG